MKKSILVCIFILTIIPGAHSQSLLHHPEAYFAPPPGSEKYFYDLQHKDNTDNYEPRIRYSLDVGTAFTNVGGFGSALSSYFSPSVRYRLFPKFDIEIGGTFIYTSPGGSFSSVPAGIPETNYTRTSYLFYARGNYRISDRLNIDGAFMKSTGNNNFLYNYPYRVNQNMEHYSLGLNYKLSDAIRIGAHFNYSNGAYPGYFLNPYPGRSSGYFYPFTPSDTDW